MVDRLHEALATRSILVAEDDDSSRVLIEKALKKLGVGRVIVTEDGEKAWAAIEASEKPFSLIIADWNMPNSTGIELLRKVRSAGMTVPFVILTAQKTFEAAVEAKDEGVDAFLTKPYSIDQLGRRILEVFHN